MQIPQAKTLWSDAGERVRRCSALGKIIAIYTGLLAAVSVVCTVGQYILDNGISQTGGLQYMQLRSVLSTISTILPIVQTFLTLCLGLGLTAVFLRVARGQFVSPRTLKAGFERVWPLVKCNVLQGLILFGVGLAAFYGSMLLFALSPLSSGVQSVLSGIDTESLLSTGELTLSDAEYSALLESVVPAVILFFVVYLACIVPILYGYRMVDYLLIDHPGIRARQALRTSRALMRGNRFRLFRMDLRLWWYYALLGLTSVLAYTDVLLSAFGVTLPVSDTAAYFISYALCLAAEAAIYCLARPRVETAYALVYDAIAPKREQTGAVLGNIFDLARQS